MVGFAFPVIPARNVPYDAIADSQNHVAHPILTQAIDINLKTLGGESDMCDLPISHLFDSFMSHCKEAFTQRTEQENYFIMEKYL